jgi:hypothetical protein
MAGLFQTTQQNISLHLQNIYAEGELQRGATHKESLSVRISPEMAQSKAEQEYDKFKALSAAQDRPIDAAFEQAVKQLPKPLRKPRKKKP